MNSLTDIIASFFIVVVFMELHYTNKGDLRVVLSSICRWCAAVCRQLADVPQPESTSVRRVSQQSYSLQYGVPSKYVS